MQRWLHPDNVWQLPPSTGRPHPPRRPRRFLTCHHGNHPNTPIKEKFNVRDGSRASTHFCCFRFCLLKHTVTSMLMMSPSWSGRLQQANTLFWPHPSQVGRNSFWVSGDSLPIPVGYAVTDHVVHRRAHWFREAPVSKRGWVRVVHDCLLVHDEIYFICCHTNLESHGLQLSVRVSAVAQTQGSGVTTYPETSSSESQDMPCKLTCSGKTFNLLLVFNFYVIWPLWDMTTTYIVRSHNMLKRGKNNRDINSKHFCNWGFSNIGLCTDMTHWHKIKVFCFLFFFKKE